MTDNVISISTFTRQDRNTALLRQIAEAALELHEVPVEDLSKLIYGGSTAYMTLYGALKILEEKLCQMNAWSRAKRFEQEIVWHRLISAPDQPLGLSP